MSATHRATVFVFGPQAYIIVFSILSIFKLELRLANKCHIYHIISQDIGTCQDIRYQTNQDSPSNFRLIQTIALVHGDSSELSDSAPNQLVAPKTISSRSYRLVSSIMVFYRWFAGRVVKFAYFRAPTFFLTPNSGAGRGGSKSPPFRFLPVDKNNFEMNSLAGWKVKPQIIVQLLPKPQYCRDCDTVLHDLLMLLYSCQ